jgi:hypothetical protein
MKRLSDLLSLQTNMIVSYWLDVRLKRLRIHELSPVFGKICKCHKSCTLFTTNEKVVRLIVSPDSHDCEILVRRETM